MIDKIIKGIKYRLDEENLTAVVIYKKGYEGDIIIPETVVFKKVAYCVTSIVGWAFEECSSLTSIVIPDSVTSIGDWAFARCSSLTSIVIPDSVTSIGEEAFYGCKSLTSVVVAEGNTVYDSREQCNAIIHTATNTLIRGCQNTIIPDSVTSIVGGAFEYCSSLTSIVIPDGVTSIGYAAFCDCSSLTSIVIPDSVTSIGEWAFSDCSSLTSITFNGTKAQWKRIKLGDYWNDEVPTKVIHCTDGEVEI